MRGAVFLILLTFGWLTADQAFSFDTPPMPHQAQRIQIFEDQIQSLIRNPTPQNFQTFQTQWDLDEESFEKLVQYFAVERHQRDFYQKYLRWPGKNKRQGKATALGLASELPMAIPPKKDRFQNYLVRRYFQSPKEMAATFGLSLAQVYGELAEYQMNLILDPLSRRADYYQKNYTRKTTATMSKELGVHPAQVHYELKRLDLDLYAFIHEPLSTQSLETLGREWPPFRQKASRLQTRLEAIQRLAEINQLGSFMAATALETSTEVLDHIASVAGWYEGNRSPNRWHLPITHRGYPRFRLDLVYELLLEGLSPAEILNKVNQDRPVSDLMRLDELSLVSRIRQEGWSDFLQTERPRSSSIPSGLSLEAQKEFIAEAVFKFWKTTKQLPQVRDFLPEPEAREENRSYVKVRYDEWVSRFGTRAQAWIETKNLIQQKYPSESLAFKLMDLPCDPHWNQDIRETWKSEVVQLISRFSNQTKPSSLQEIVDGLSERYAISREALFATNDYAIGAPLHHCRIFNSQSEFISRVEKEFSLKLIGLADDFGQ